MWSHHKIYCGDCDLSTNSSADSNSRYSRCNAYLRSVGYAPKQQKRATEAVAATCRRKKTNINSVSCGTSMQESNDGGKFV